MHMLDRLKKVRKELRPFLKTEYCVVYEDIDMDCCAVYHPSPEAITALMHGDVFPPVWVYWELKKDEAKPDFTRHTRSHLLHDTPREGPKTEEEALLYLIMKDVPEHIWRNYNKSNSIKMKICKKNQLPQSREFRDSWRVAA
jgi:hypothetical protein